MNLEDYIDNNDERTLVFIGEEYLIATRLEEYTENCIRSMLIRGKSIKYIQDTLNNVGFGENG